MSEHTPTHFIKNIINADLANGLHEHISVRFPPEPNGYLHIGHAKSICLNFGLAEEYGGTCNLRFDDTNPTKESVEYITAIKDHVIWLGFSWDKLTYSSDYFPQFYQYAVELIEKGLAYVCFLNAEEMRTYRGTLTSPGINSPNRDSSVATNLEHFANMKAGKYAEGECVLRLKIDMSSSFIVLRDPIIYRINTAAHHQTGTQWCIYPMYDFAHPISDAIEGITHSLCTLEFQDNRRLYDWILEHLADFNTPTRPKQYEFSRLNLAYTLMSKRKITKLINDHKVSGWDDPRLPTLAGIRRRGFTPNAIKLFAERIGISKVDSVTDMKILEDSVRDDLNVNAPRAMAVLHPLLVEITNYNEESEALTAINHPQNQAFGTRTMFFGKYIYIDQNDFVETPPNNKYKRLAIGKEVRLRNAYVINATHFDTDTQGNVVKVYATYDKETLGKNPNDGRKVKGVIHFVEQSHALAAEFRLYDRLFDTELPSEDQEIWEHSLVITEGVVEASLKDAELGNAYQFEREGYFAKDCDSTEEKLVFNKTVSLITSWS